MRVSINERQEVNGAATAQTKYFLQGTLEECQAILELLDDQAIDKEERDALADLTGGKVIELDATEFLSVPASAMAEGSDDVITFDEDDLNDNQRERIVKAAEAIYFSAYWRPDRPCEVSDLWNELGNALGLATHRTKTLGDDRLAPSTARIDAEPPLFYELRSFFENVLAPTGGEVADKAAAHVTAKMFMARYRSRGGQPSKMGDSYYLDAFKNQRTPDLNRFDEGVSFGKAPRAQAAE